MIKSDSLSPVEYLARLAVTALEMEVTLAPKPGLVDRYDDGAHNDMNLQTFYTSIHALSPYFQAYALAGWQHKSSPQELFDQVRQIGVRAEQAMFQATHQINTHKGANFSFAVLLAASGYYLSQQKNPQISIKPQETEQILAYVRSMTTHLIEEDLASLDRDQAQSYGEKLYLQHKVKGVRGEAVNGYPALERVALPYLRQKLEDQDQGGSITLEDHLLRTLIYLMTQVEDSNLIHRGGIKAWQKVQAEAKNLLVLEPSSDWHQTLQEYNQILIQRYLSPGGAADLLSLSIFFGLLEGLFLPQVFIH